MLTHSQRLIGVALALGVLLGYLAASVNLRNPSTAAPPQPELLLAQADAKAPAAKPAGKPNELKHMSR